ncbi:MAG: hypothetical protein Tsb009_31250 [Planctomycetaceae bacterium]
MQGPLEVLVADDSRTIRTQLEQILTEAGYEVTTVGNGREAIERVEKRIPFLMVLDIDMPELDGYGVCQELQTKGQPYSQIPIVFLTTHNLQALETLGGEVGAYLRKPTNRKELLETVELFLPKRADVATE